MQLGRARRTAPTWPDAGNVILLRPDLSEEVVQSRRKTRLYTWQQLKALPPPEWLIDGILPKAGFSVLFGPPNVGKTFLALDLALQRAIAGDLVIYVAGEGKPGIASRVSAWLTEYGHADNALENFRVHDGPVEMLAEKAVKDFIADLRGLERPPAMIVLDTLARCFGAGDENSAQHMGSFIKQCDLLRDAWPGCSVLVLHHTGKDERKGARGSSALLGAADCVMELSGSRDLLTLQCEKMKDAERFKPQTLELTARHGSCVIVGANQKVPMPSGKLPASARKALDLLPVGNRVFLEEWRDMCMAGSVSHSDSDESRRKAFDRAKKILVQKGRITIEPDASGCFFACRTKGSDTADMS